MTINEIYENLWFVCTIHMNYKHPCNSITIHGIYENQWRSTTIHKTNANQWQPMNTMKIYNIDLKFMKNMLRSIINYENQWKI